MWGLGKVKENIGLACSRKRKHSPRGQFLLGGFIKVLKK